MNPPILLAFLLADKVFREMETGKVHIAGTFNQLSTLNFPMVHPVFFVYLCLTDMKPGNRSLAFEMRYLENGMKILKVDQTIQSPGPADIIEMNLCFNNITFQQEGTVELVLSCDGHQLGTRVLKIKLVKEPGT